MVKEKIELPSDVVISDILETFQKQHRDDSLDLADGVKILLDKSWVQVRPSNTEPIIRIMAEAPTSNDAKQLVDEYKNEIRTYMEDQV